METKIKKYSLKQDGDKKLSPHFKVKEFACKDGSDPIIIDDDLIEILESLRLKLGKPIIIMSGYRTYDYNYKIKGAINSYHTKGQAADIVVSGMSPILVGLYAVAMGARGCGIYKNFTHIDCRDTAIMWEGESKDA